MEEWKQACQASETTLKEVLSKGDIDEALRRENEAKKTLEETQKVVEELQKSNSDLQAVLASTSTRAEQLQKQVEEYASTLAIQQLQSSKQLDDVKNARMMLEQQLNVTRQQLQESQQQFNLYKSTHPAVTVEELSSLQAASDRLKGVEAELTQLKQIQEKRENKKLKGKSKVTQLIQTSAPSLFQKRSSIDLSLPAEKRLSVSDSDTTQATPIQPLLSPPGLSPVQPPVSTPKQSLGLNPVSSTTKTNSE